MSRSIRKGALAAAAVAVVIPLAAGCGAGFNAASERVAPAGSGQLDQIQVLNAALVIDKATGAAVFSGRIVNNGKGPDTLQSITVDGKRAQFFKLSASSGVPATQPLKSVGTPPPGSVSTPNSSARKTAGSEVVVSSLPLPSLQSLQLGGDLHPAVTVSASGLKLGTFASMAFTFGTAGVLDMNVIVMPATGFYSGITPPPGAVVSGARPASTPSTSPSAPASPGTTPTPGTTATPGMTASPHTTATPRTGVNGGSTSSGSGKPSNTATTPAG